MHLTSRLRRFTAVAGAATLLGASLSLLTLSSADARKATGGSGPHQSAIVWTEWAAHGQAVTNGAQSVTTQDIGGKDLTTVCTISNISGALSGYRPGNFAGDAFDDLYNIGGTGGANTLVSGLARFAGTTTFDVICAVQYDGAGFALGGFVIGDSEQSDQDEFVQATSDGGQWRQLAYSSSCGADERAVTDAGNTLALIGTTSYCNGGSGPAGVAFLDQPNTLISSTFTIHGQNLPANGDPQDGCNNPDGCQGTSAISIGVMIPLDLGDAPASYGEAGSLIASGFSGGLVPASTDTVINAASTKATLGVPGLRLGATTDNETGSQASAGATGDGADEDAITAPASITASPGGDYTLPSVACNSGTIAGWIDWDGNGAFQADEGSDPAACAGGSVDLDWTVPADVTDVATSYIRLRTGTSAAQVAQPTGINNSGEVEDYATAIVLADPSMTLTKEGVLNDTNGNDVADEGETVDYTFRVSNTGNVALSNVTIDDDKVTGIDPASADIAVDDDAIFTADPYVVTAADVAHGSVDNTAVANGEDPDGNPVASNEDSVSIPTGDVPGGGGGGGGDDDDLLPDTGAPTLIAIGLLGAALLASGGLLVRRNRSQKLA